MKIRFLFFFLLFLGLSACGLFQRSPYSYYENTDAYSLNAYYQEKNLYLIQEAKKELGIPPKTPLSPKQESAIRKRVLVKKLERRLRSKKEKKQYYNYLPYLSNDDEKIQLLQLPSTEQRNRWILAHQKRIATRPHPIVDLAIEKKDIIPGMKQKDVIESWGEPQSIEVAGNPLYKNERWKYQKMIPSNEGYKKEVRIIYFEGGRVVGWETYADH
ncbi:MAG: hypothetical protein D6797_02980 [Bdellovibrio sp.]|nr:MAG: hypothetical protein D6797_02980 [Bdellovibrio sp.]